MDPIMIQILENQFITKEAASKLLLLENENENENENDPLLGYELINLNRA